MRISFGHSEECVLLYLRNEEHNRFSSAPLSAERHCGNSILAPSCEIFGNLSPEELQLDYGFYLCVSVCKADMQEIYKSKKVDYRLRQKDEEPWPQIDPLPFTWYVIFTAQTHTYTLVSHRGII